MIQPIMWMWPKSVRSVALSSKGIFRSSAPQSSFTLDWVGNLYGTTNGGGASGFGVVCKVDRSGYETMLYTFTGGNDGGFSNAGLIRDLQGNLYGTTSSRGGASGAGVVFKVDTSGNAGDPAGSASGQVRTGPVRRPPILYREVGVPCPRLTLGTKCSFGEAWVCSSSSLVAGRYIP